MQKKTYDILISLAVLFLFLSLLFFRMAWKLNYRFNNELVDICDNVVSDYEALDFKVVNYRRYRLYDDEYYEKMNYYYTYVSDIKTAIDEGKISVRTDYEYTIERVLNNLNILKDQSYVEEYGYVLEEEMALKIQAERDVAYKDLNILVGWHHASIFFGFLFIASSLFCIVFKIVKVKIKKEDKQIY